MALNNLITDTDSLVINTAGIVTASLGICAIAVLVTVMAIKSRSRPRQAREAVRALPTRMLYVSMLASLWFSACWIVSCSSVASNTAACNFAMWGIIFTTHLINGLLLSILLHCGLLLSSRTQRFSTIVVLAAIGCVVAGSLALSFGGLASGRFGYLPDQDTCWIVPTSNGSATDSAYKLEAILLYGPIFGCLLMNFAGLAYVWIGIAKIRRENKTMDMTKLKSLVLRLSFTPAFLALHCLMVLGGDLPITYHSRAAQFTSYLMNYVGFSALSLALAICAVFFDPAFSTIIQRKMAISTRSQRGEGTQHQQISIHEVPPRSGSGGGGGQDVKVVVHTISTSPTCIAMFNETDLERKEKRDSSASALADKEEYEPVLYNGPINVPSPKEVEPIIVSVKMKKIPPPIQTDGQATGLGLLAGLQARVAGLSSPPPTPTSVPSTPTHHLLPSRAPTLMTGPAAAAARPEVTRHDSYSFTPSRTLVGPTTRPASRAGIGSVTTPTTATTTAPPPSCPLPVPPSSPPETPVLGSSSPTGPTFRHSLTRTGSGRVVVVVVDDAAGGRLPTRSRPTSMQSNTHHHQP